MSMTKQQMVALLDAAKKNTEWALQHAFLLGQAAGKSEEALRSIERAAEMLDMDAEELKMCHTIGGNWSGEAEAKADYDERKRIAKALRGIV